MEIKEMKIEDIEARKAEIMSEIEKEDADFDALNAEVDALEARKKELKEEAEKRNALAAKVANGEVGTVKEEGGKMTELEERAMNFAQTGKTARSIVTTGKIAMPTQVGGINDLPENGTDIVDDVFAVALNGNGEYKVAYKKTASTAEDVTDGEKIGGTGLVTDYVTISPKEWGVIDEISNQIKKMTPLAYESAVVNSAVSALRDEASNKIVEAIKASSLAEKVTAAIDADYLRTLTIGFKAIKNKGEVKLYLAREDLVALGKVRGTAEKKPLYTITFDAGTTNSGVISEGGTACAFRILDTLTAGTQLFGQPQTIEMPMWGDYEVATDEHEKFSSNMIVVRGLQTANADLCAYHGMQIVSNA